MLSACSQMIYKYPVVKRSPVNATELQISKVEAKTESAKDCVRIILLFPTKFSYDSGKLYEEICPGSDYLYDVELERNFWIIPILYAQDCVTLKAKCEK